MKMVAMVSLVGYGSKSTDNEIWKSQTFIAGWGHWNMALYLNYTTKSVVKNYQVQIKLCN